LVTEHSKAAALYEFYNNLLGVSAQRSSTINLDLVNLQQLEMSSLAEQFTEEEVLRVIRALPSNKALGPDGFIARFLQLA
jgi:hypothetical protein